MAGGIFPFLVAWPPDAVLCHLASRVSCRATTSLGEGARFLFCDWACVPGGMSCVRRERICPLVSSACITGRVCGGGVHFLAGAGEETLAGTTKEVASGVHPAGCRCVSGRCRFPHET